MDNLSTSTSANTSKPERISLPAMLAVALAYFASARLGMMFAPDNSGASPIWPPVGVALVAFLLLGRRYWPGVAAAAFVADYVVLSAQNAAAHWTIALTSLGMAAGSTLEPLACAALLALWLRKVEPLSRPIDVFAWVVCAAAASCIGASLGTASLVWHHIVPSAVWAEVALNWWMGDLGGLLVVAPALWVWCRPQAAHRGPARRLEWALATAALAAVLYAVFGASGAEQDQQRLLAYLCMAFEAYAAWRLGLRGVTLATLMMAGYAIDQALHGSGPFAYSDRSESLILLVSFICLCGVTGLLLAADLIERQAITGQPPRLRPLAPPWLTLFLALGASVWAWNGIAQDTEDLAQSRFERKTTDIDARLSEHMQTYQQMLLGAQGLFAAHADVQRVQWQAYVRSLNLAEQMPGTQGLGFARMLAPAERAEFVAHRRAQGSPGFDITPPGERSVYSAIVYMEPYDGRNLRALGYDLFSDPINRAAMEQARDTGLWAASGKVHLLGETRPDAQAGMLIYQPIYRGGSVPATVAQRQAKLMGFVYGMFRMDDLVRSMLAPALDDVTLEIFDGHETSRDALMFASRKPPLTARTLTQTRTIWVASHPWTLRFTALPAFDAGTDRQKPQGALLAGCVISLLMFTLVRSLAMVGERAQALADTAAKALRESEAKLGALIDSTEQAVVISNADGRIVSWNHSASVMFGYTADEALGMSVAELLPARLRQAYRAGEAQELLALHKTGQEFPIQASMCSWSTAEGRFSGAIIRDISEAERANAFLRTMFHEAHDAILVVEHDGRIAYANQKAVELFGYSMEALLSMNVDALLPQALRGRHAQHRASYAAQPHQRLMGMGLDLHALRADGSQLAIDVALTPLHYLDTELTVATVSDVTEARRARDALRSTEERLRLMIDGVADYAILTLDTTGHVTSWNVGAERLLGWRAEDILGQPLSRFATPEDLERKLPSNVLQQAALEGRFGREVWLQRRDGTRFFADVLMTALRGRSGDLQGFLCVTRDLTEQRDSREALVAANRRLSLAAQAAQVGVWELDVATGTLLWDARMFEIYQLNALEVADTYAAWRHCVVAEDLPAIERQLQAAIANGSELDDAFRIEWANGNRRAIRTRALMVPGEDGKTARVVGVNWDVTEMQETDARMREVLTLQTAILGSADLSIIATDPSGTILSFNRAAQQMLGYNAEEMIRAQTPAVIHDPAEVLARAQALSQELGRPIEPGFEVFVAKARQGGADLNEWTYIRKDGSRFPVLLSVTGIFNADGSLFGFLGIASDITEQKARESAIEGALAEKETLLREVYHRVKNNLQVITSLFNLQLRTLPEGAARDALRESADRVRAMALVHEKLYRSSNLASLNMSSYIGDLCQQLCLGAAAQERGIALRTEIQALEVGLERAVPLGLLINELVSNSIKHAFPAGGGQLSVSLSRADEHHARLEVRDTGPGFPAGLDIKQSRSLGLKLVTTLATQLDGKVEMRSDGGAVTTVTFKYTDTEPAHA